MDKKYVFLSSAYGGIGKAVLDKLLQSETPTIALTRTEEQKIELEKNYNSNLLILYSCDVEDYNSLEIILEDIISKKLMFKAIIHCLGIMRPGPLSLQSPQDFQKHFKVNLFPVHIINQKLLPWINQNGRIIHVSSTSGQIGHSYLGGYASSYFAVEGYYQVLRKELNSTGIKVKIIVPSVVNTKLHRDEIFTLRESYKGTDFENVLPKLKSMVNDEIKTNSISTNDVAAKIINIMNDNSNKKRYYQFKRKFNFLRLRISNWIQQN